MKPGFFLNDLLAEISPLGRLLFAGLWCHADRDGKLEDRPKRLKAAILPFDECDIPQLLDDLEQRGFIRRYKSGEVPCIEVVNFTKHQKIHKNELPSLLGANGSELIANTSRLGATELELELELKSKLKLELEPEFDSPPAGMTVHQLAKALLEALEVPGSNNDLAIVADAIRLRAGKMQSSLSAAYEFILAKALDAKDDGSLGRPIFWIKDAQYNATPPKARNWKSENKAAEIAEYKRKTAELEARHAQGK